MGKAEHSGDYLLCSSKPHWRAHGSTYLPAERPIGACSLWRTPLGPGRFSHLRVRTTRPLATTGRLVPPIHSGTWMSMIITSLWDPSQLNVGLSLGGAPIFRLTNDSWAKKRGIKPRKLKRPCADSDACQQHNRWTHHLGDRRESVSLLSAGGSHEFSINSAVMTRS